MRRPMSRSSTLRLTGNPSASAILAAILLASAFSSCTATLPNLYEAKKEIRYYYDKGGYAKDFANVVAKARQHLANQLDSEPGEEGSKKLAIVLDIDETSLSNYEFETKIDFGFDQGLFSEWVEKSSAPALEPTLELYRFATERGVAVFFITGRKERERAATEKNLVAVGYEKWTRLEAKPDELKATARVYKTEVRKRIVEEGYRIVLNLGDQRSDLEGGYAEKTFLLPNPFYTVP